MKWKKRLLLLALFLAVFAGAITGGAWWMSRGQPEWYAAPGLSPAELEAAAARAEHQMQRTLSWAQDQQAREISSARGKPSTSPSQSIDVSFSEDELNGFFQKWDSTFGWSESYSSYVSQPRIALRDGRLILAATVNDLGSVLSVELAARLEDGRLALTIDRVLAGKLPLPSPLWDKYRRQAQTAIRGHLPEWQHGAEISSQGGANTDAVAAAMCELLLNMLQDQPARPVLFLPYAMQSRPRSLPVKVTDLHIENRTLTMTVEPLDRSARTNLLDEIKSQSLP